MPIHRPDLSPETVFDALRAPRRQFVLAYLRQQDRPITLSELARNATAWEVGVSPSEVEADRVDRMRLSLYHTHIPKLASLGLVEYVGDGKRTVDATERMQTVAPDLDLDALVEPRKYYTE